MEGSSIRKWLIFIGLTIVFIGVIFLALTKIGIPLGKLPGDIRVHKEKWGVYFPIVSSIVISIFLTILINFFLWLFKK